MNTLAWAMRIGLAALASGAELALLSGCAISGSQDVVAHRPQHQFSGLIVYRSLEIRQLGSGDSAYFARCLPPACPSITRKTIAVPMPEVVRVENAAGTPAVEVDAGRAEQVETAIVHFDLGSSRLDRRAQRTLAQFSAVARQSQRIIISGRTDSTGSDAFNRTLANARALAVAAYLRERGATKSERIEVDARGRCCYVARNELETERQLNRRAEVSFYPEDKDDQ